MNVLIVLNFGLLFSLGIQYAVVGERSFIASFQTHLEGSFLAKSNVWLEFSNEIPSSKEFTICQWINIKFYNTGMAGCLWSYCTIENTNDKMKCLKFCLLGIRETANRNLLVEGYIPLKTIQFVTVPLKSYLHRTWTHLCWSFSAISGISKFYHNGNLLSNHHVEVLDTDTALRGSNEMHDSALVFGQDPDDMRNGFDKNNAFIGNLSEFNIWNYTLKESEIFDMALCKKMWKGNVVSWQLPDLVINKNMAINNVVMSDLPDATILCNKYRQFVIFPEKVRYPKAKEACEIHGGNLALPTNEKETKAILKIVSKHKEACIENQSPEHSNAVWIGAEKINNVWYDVPSDTSAKTRLNYTNLSRPKSSINSECAYIGADGLWVEGNYNLCFLYVSLCTVCYFDRQPVYTLLGYCDYGVADWNFYPIFNSKNQIEFYEGYKGTNIMLEEENHKWNITAKKGFTGLLKDPFVINQLRKKPLIGRQKWLVNDPYCKHEDPLKSLTISLCNFPLEFTCNSGHCIDIKKRCNEHKDCIDGSDEEQCSLITIPTPYDMTKAPKPRSNESSTNIETHATILKISSIDTINMMVVVTLILRMKWFDERLLFLNPRLDKDNLISTKEARLLWTPLQDLLHSNAILGDVVYDEHSVIKITPNIPEVVAPEESIENLVYNGSFNALELNQRMKAGYECTFDAKKFPFDKQECRVTMKINQRKNTAMHFVSNGQVVYYGSSIVDEFTIGKIYGEIINTNTSTEFVIVIPMIRIFTNQLLNTFIPTFILWILGYSTLCVNIRNFSERFMGAGATLLVTAMILSAITKDLPKTSHIKYIDIWMLWHIISILAMLLCHIMIDRLQTFVEESQIDEAVSLVTIPFMESAKRENVQITTRINHILLITFPILNFFFYGVYFFCTTK